MIKCLIFDCDGTLVESEFLGHLCMEIQLAKYGIRESAAEMKKEFRGWKLHEIIKVILSRNPNCTLPEEFIPLYRKTLTELFEEKLQAVEGVEELLRKITLPKCIASSGPLKKIKTSMRITELGKYFNGNIFSAYEIDSWKPEPGLFLHAAKEMGCKPGECLVIEDSEVGIAAAEAAGMQSILFNPEGLQFDLPQGTVEIQSMNQLESAVTHFISL